MNSHEIALEITEKAKQHFKSNLYCVLLYGSSISAKRKPNDIDLIVILKERETKEDLKFFREKINKYEREIDLQILNTIDIKSKHFSHDSHGEFIVLFLKLAKVLYGKNPFLEINTDYSRQVTSIIQKMQYYYFKAKKIQANAPLDMDNKLYNHHRKKLLLLLCDFYLAYSGNLIYPDSLNDLKKIVSILNENLNDDELEFLLGKNEKFGWDEIFSLYQLFYFKAIDILEPKTEILNSNIENIFVRNYLLKQKSKINVIIVSGCPSDYNESEIVLFLNIRGFDVTSFHYSGTGLSIGNCFDSPISDLLKIVNSNKDKYESQIIIANSYGGFPSLFLANKLENVQKIIAISPVIDFLKLKNYITLPKYLTEERRSEYRFKEDDMLSFMNKTKLGVIEDSHKIKIIHGCYDDQIQIEDVENFCNDTGIELDVLLTGHLSLNKISRFGLKHIDKALNEL